MRLPQSLHHSQRKCPTSRALLNIALVALAEKIPDALSGVVKEARAGELKEPALDAMLDGISAR
ncbi:hypothetical protein ACVSQB_37620 [Bradyrhizobium elkanii]